MIVADKNMNNNVQILQILHVDINLLLCLGFIKVSSPYSHKTIQKTKVKQVLKSVINVM